MIRRTIALAAVLLAIGAMLLGGVSQAADKFPDKPINLYVGFPPGGVAGVTARALAPGMEKNLGEPLVIMHKPGAGGTLAISALVRSEPDGYTLANAATATLCYSMFTKGVNWGPKDFTMILGYAFLNHAMVSRADAPWNNFEEWVAYVREHPGFKYSTFAPMSGLHILMEWIAKTLNLKVTPVHFLGDAPGLNALLGGHVQMHLAAGSHAALIKAGKLKTILQVSGEPADPNPKSVSRLSEEFPNCPLEVFVLPVGVFGPKGISPDIRKKLTAACKEAALDPLFAKALATMNMKVHIVEPEELQKDLEIGSREFTKMIKELGLKKK